MWAWWLSAALPHFVRAVMSQSAALTQRVKVKLKSQPIYSEQTRKPPQTETSRSARGRRNQFSPVWPQQHLLQQHLLQLEAAPLAAFSQLILPPGFWGHPHCRTPPPWYIMSICHYYSLYLISSLHTFIHFTLLLIICLYFCVSLCDFQWFMTGDSFGSFPVVFKSVIGRSDSCDWRSFAWFTVQSNPSFSGPCIISASCVWNKLFSSSLFFWLVVFRKPAEGQYCKSYYKQIW